MPRMEGVSSTSTVWRMRFNPRPFTDSRWLCSVPRRPPMRVTRIFFVPAAAGLPCLAMSVSSARDLFDLLAALGRDLGRTALLREPVEGRAHDVVGIGGAVALGGDVRDTHHLEHRAHGAAGLDAVAFGGGLHHHAGRPVLAHHVVVDRAALQRDLHEVAARLLHGLLHGHRHFTRLALAHADGAVAVAYHGERGEAEDAPALHHLGDAVHRDHLLAKTIARTVVAHPAFLVVSSHVWSLELEAAFARRLGERLHAPVVAESRAVERHFRDAGGLRLLGDALAHLGRRFLLGAVGEGAAHVLLEGRGGGEHLAARRVDDLRVDVLVGAMHGEAHGTLAVDA